MTASPTDLAQVPLGSLKRYLEATAWRRRTLASGNELFTFGPESEIEIVLPVTVGDQDFDKRIYGALTTLTAVERQPVAAIISEIRSIDYDLIKAHLPDHSVRHDAVRLGVAEVFIRRMTHMLAASAHNELHSSPYFLRMDSIAQRYAEDDCRFGHTFHGSFGLTIESHVGPRTVEQTFDEPPSAPLPRRVIRRLARGLLATKRAIERDDPTEIVTQYERAFNANACEDLLSIIDTPQVGDVKFDIRFSPEWGDVPDMGRSVSVHLQHPRVTDILRQAAKDLRVVNYNKEVTIQGKMRTVHSSESVPDLFVIAGTQEIWVEWDSEQYGRRNVRVALTPDEFVKALDAFTAGKTITVSGELEQGRSWRLDNARDIVFS